MGRVGVLPHLHPHPGEETGLSITIHVLTLSHFLGTQGL